MLVHAKSLQFEYGARVLFDDLNLLVDKGDRVGLVGRNGAGKTTLMKVLAGELEAKGILERTGSVGYLPQDPLAADPKLTALSRILSGRQLDDLFAKLTELQHLMTEANGPAQERATKEYGHVETLFANRDGYRAESDATVLANSLGIEAYVLTQPIGVLSGGQRRRIELARILFSEADLLLLDEPTNHLDADSINWLIDFLKNFHGGLIVISHDARLLESVVNRVAFLDPQRSTLDLYALHYRAYLVARAEDEARRRHQYEVETSKATQLKRQADKMRGSSAKRARKAKVLDRRAIRILDNVDDVRLSEKVANIRFPQPLPCTKTPIQANGLAKSYGSLEVLSGIDLAIDRQSRVVILGLNGAGKTTLLRLLANVELPDAGEIHPGKGLVVGYYAQEHEMLNPDLTPLENLRSGAPADVTDTDLRQILGSFMFTSEMFNQPSGTLSGGEKTRLALATLVSQRANLLLLDEPTNNLDPASRDRVLAALRGYTGAIILVTHDPGAVEALKPERVLMLPDGVEDYWNEELLELVTLA
jgi:ATPase subunit of ABC transporter with duplicated ATPase domains